MIDLHLHLDGSLSPDFVWNRLKEEVHDCEITAEEVKKRMRVPENCKNLTEYLECFALPVQVLQSAEALTAAVEELTRRLQAQGLSYAEIRFAPQLHRRKGLTQEETVEAAINGLRWMKSEPSDFSAQLILCCMRGAQDTENKKTLDMVEKYLGKGVCAADIAGDEASFATAGYRQLFAYARDLSVPYTIHAGEADGPASVWAALELGAHRIGHGVRAGEDPVLLRELVDRRIPLEMCPSSNLHTRVMLQMKEYPLREYLRKGLCVTVNTDNMTVSGTTLRQEYEALRQECGLTGEEEQQLLRNAVQAAFLPEEDKKKLMQ